MAEAEFQATLVQEAQRLPTGRWEGVADENGDRKCEDNCSGSCRDQAGPYWKRGSPQTQVQEDQIQVREMVLP